jgi:hypothetical protein
MREVTVDGVPWSQLPSAKELADPDTNLPGDRAFIELLRGGDFAAAKRDFPELYTNPHVGFLAQLTEQPAPQDGDGPIAPLTEAQFLGAIEYLEGPTKPA